MSGANANERWLAAGVAGLLLIATLGEGGGSATGLLVWHFWLVLLLLAALLAPRTARAGPATPQAGPLIAGSLFLGLVAIGAARVPYAYAAFLNLLELAACLAVFGLAVRLGPEGAGLLRRPLGLGAVAQAGFVIWQWVTGGAARPAGTFLNTNHMAGWMGAVLLLALGGSGEGRSRSDRFLGASTALLAGIAMVASGSRGAMLGTVVGLLWLARRRWSDVGRRGRTAMAVAALILAILGGWSLQRRQRESDPFRYQRLKIWKASLGVFLEEPWWGAGPGQFPVASMRHQFADGEEPLRYDRRFRSTHSDLMRPVCDYGAPAALALFVAVGLSIGVIRRGRRGGRLRREQDGAIAALIAIGVQALVDNPSRWPALYLLACALLGSLLSRRAGSPRERFSPPVRLGLAILLALFFVVGDLGPTLGHRIAIRLPRGALTDRQAARLDTALRRNPLHPDYWMRRAEHLSEPGPEWGPARYAEAREAAEQAVRLQPEDSRYAWGLARLEARACLQIFRDEASRDRAFRRFERAQELSPRDPRISIDAGRFLLSAGDFARARRMADRALRIEPAGVPARLLLAESMLEAGGPGAASRAAALLAEAVELDERWAAAGGRGVYHREMMTLDRRDVERIRNSIVGNTAPGSGAAEGRVDR